MTAFHAILSFCTVVGCLPRPAFAFFGSDHGNPGDTVVREFTLTAQDIYNRMKLLPASELAGIDMNKLQGVIVNTEVISRPQVFDPETGTEVPAMNFPSRTPQLIVVNSGMWGPLRNADRTESRLGVVLHENLFLAGVNDENFTVSNRIVSQLNVKNFNSGRIWNPLNPVNRVSTNLVFNPGGCELKGFDFNTQEQEETSEESTSGPCGEAFRRVIVHKSHLQAPPSSPWQGTFHRFEVTVLGAAGQTLGAATVEPEWGRCLLPTDGGCEVGGKLFLGGVEFRFWFKR